jgi:hypothetical protein
MAAMRTRGTASFVDAAPSSLIAPMKQKPLRGIVRIRRCFSPESQIAGRAALTRLVIADSDTARPSPVLGDDAFRVLHEMGQPVEDLRLDHDRLGVAYSSRRATSRIKSSNLSRMRFQRRAKEPTAALSVSWRNDAPALRKIRQGANAFRMARRRK